MSLFSLMHFELKVKSYIYIYIYNVEYCNCKDGSLRALNWVSCVHES